MRAAAGLVAVFVCSAVLAAEPAQRTLTFDERVRAQTAIERVYYAHQLGATKRFEEAVPQAIVEGKVHKYLEQTAALEAFWKTEVTDQTLQREIERMAQGTRMPDRLQELYAALGNDPFLVKECLARPALVDRLTHNFYAFDAMLHVQERGRADALHGLLASGELSPTADNSYRSITELVVSPTDAGLSATGQPLQRSVTAEEFQKQRAEYPARLGQMSDVKETRDAFAFSVVLTETTTDLRVANYVVPKIAWDAWWAEARRAVRGDAVVAVASGSVDFPPQKPTGAGCAAYDKWNNGVLDDPIEARYRHSAVWTGSTMIVWGGEGSLNVVLNSGSRYDPATDTWTATSNIGAPSARMNHTAVWTGSMMVVWGGGDRDNIGDLNTGGRYDPLTDAWTPTSDDSAPSVRYQHTAIWTGQVMIVWGGRVGSYDDDLSTGSRYDPLADTWIETSTVGAPYTFGFHTAVWTDQAMIVWGGNGGRYDPVTDAWLPISAAGAPPSIFGHTALWTGSEMLIWAGVEWDPSCPPGACRPRAVNTGARYSPAADSWTPMSTVGAPTPRISNSAVWTGTQMVIWGGDPFTGNYAVLGDGGRYDPRSDTWTPTSLVGAPATRKEHSAIWTGSVMVVWGGDSIGIANTGARYDPAVDAWTPTSTGGSISGRSGHTAIWTGDVAVVWGGRDGHSDLDTGGRYDPTLDVWTSTAVVGAPSARTLHTAVWTGAEMIVWGGRATASSTVLQTGGRYEPTTDTWTSVSTSQAPLDRESHTAVWTGTRMVIWGGYHSGYLNSGGLYDPGTDTWTPTSLTGAPPGRYDHSAVWIDNRMVVWGGVGLFGMNGYSGVTNTGGQYDPVTNAWTPTSLNGAPGARRAHASVSTGTSMIVWGGDNFGSLNTGGRYNPMTDAWTPTTTVGAPAGRSGHRAIWTGNEMVVWGGKGAYSWPSSNTGGRFNPVANVWAPTSTVGAPMGRGSHTAIWTGSMMMVWGGDAGSYVDSGGLYTPDLSSDHDGDGYTECAGDCNDGDPAIHPGAADICDGVDNDCDGITDNGGNALCDDRNGCTDDLCAGTAGCGHTNNNSPCDDRNQCTSGDICGGGACAGTNIDGIGCDDGDRCTTGDTCNGGVCGGTAINCDDHNGCTTDTCYSYYGCFYYYNANPCSDGNACTVDDACFEGACRPGPAVVCNDNNACTDDSCNPATGACSYVNDDTNACSDGSLCTQTDTCHAGVCGGSNPVQCGEGCPPGSTTVGGVCQKTYDIDANLLFGLPWGCDDTGKDLFTDEIGLYGFRWNDLGGSPATVVRVDVQLELGLNCDGSERSAHLNNGGGSEFSPGYSCDCPPLRRTVSLLDVDAGAYALGGVNTISIYSNGLGEGLSKASNLANSFARVTVTYSPNPNSCRVGECNPGTGVCGFSSLPDGLACTDGNACTGGDSCSGGTCLGGPSIDCDDRNACTDDACNAQTGCVHNANSSACDDGNPCTDDSCDPSTGCVHSNNTNPCSDGSVCTIGDACNGGSCVGTAIICNDGNACTTDGCNPSIGCVFANNSSTCDDGNACTSGDICANGTCHPGDAVACNDNNPCTTDSCNPTTGCVYDNNTNACDDGNACTTGDTCGGGTCHGSVIACDDNNLCTTDSCNPATGCVFANNSVTCDDGNACTSSDTCGGGSCHGAAIACNDNNPCTTDTCNAATGCVFTNNSNSCNDSNACTKTDICTNGACVGSNPVTCGAADQCHAPGICDSASGACSNPTLPDGTTCNDQDLCTAGETCRAGTCTPASSGLNEANPRTTGYYKRLCQGPHSGDQLTDADAVCVASVAHTFAGVSTVADLCAELTPTQPNSDPCDRTDDDLMVLALNICRARVCVAQSIDSQCGINGNVGQSLAESDAILGNASRNAVTCAHAKCVDEEINTGRALELNSLTIRRDTSGTRLEWRPPYLNDGTGHPSKYDLWRRVQGSLAPFTKLGATTDEFFVDEVTGSGAFQYEVTAVMN